MRRPQRAHFLRSALFRCTVHGGAQPPQASAARVRSTITVITTSQTVEVLCASALSAQVGFGRVIYSYTFLLELVGLFSSTNTIPPPAFHRI